MLYILAFISLTYLAWKIAKACNREVFNIVLAFLFISAFFNLVFNFLFSASFAVYVMNLENQEQFIDATPTSSAYTLVEHDVDLNDSQKRFIENNFQFNEASEDNGFVLLVSKIMRRSHSEESEEVTFLNSHEISLSYRTEEGLFNVKQVPAYTKIVVDYELDGSYLQVNSEERELVVPSNPWLYPDFIKGIIGMSFKTRKPDSDITIYLNETPLLFSKDINQFVLTEINTPTLEATTLKEGD